MPAPPDLPIPPGDATAAVEAERRRIAALLDGRIVEPLGLLLSQAHAYEQTMSANPQARLVASVLSSLAGRVIQQVRDLEADLYPALLFRLGLAPALEAYAGQVERAEGLRVALALARLDERLPVTLELALYRLAQAAVERAGHTAGATRVALRLEARGDRLILSAADNGLRGGDDPLPDALRAASARVEQVGGQIETGRAAEGGLLLSASLALRPAADLTPRERDVLRLLAEGRTNREIGAVLHISHRTVNFHLDNLYTKLGVTTRTEAVIEALRRDWIDPG